MRNPSPAARVFHHGRRRWMQPRVCFTTVIVGVLVFYHAEELLLLLKEETDGMTSVKASRPFTPLLDRHYILSPKELFQEHFPHCLPSFPRMEGDSDGDRGSLPEQWLNWLNTTVFSEENNNATNNNTTNKNHYDTNESTVLFRYIRSETPPLYDHVTCPVMKARYNCARSPVDPQNASTNSSMGQQYNAASDYKFVWRQHAQSPWCDLETLTKFVHGPASVSQQSIVMQGNSYLRQIWEALVCGFQSQITNLTLLSHGRPTSMAYIVSRGGKLLQKQELGSFLINQQQTMMMMTDGGSRSAGCHAPSRHIPLSRYYHENVSIPPSLDHCSDDLAMVEFGYHLRIFFLFHPSRFHPEALKEVYSQLNIPEQVDVLVWVDPLEQVLRNRTMTRGSTSTTASTTGLSTIHGNIFPSLRRVQEASIGYYYGADNPWITNPPDNHPCLPGIPDDAVNILIFLLLLDDYERTTRRTLTR